MSAMIRILSMVLGIIASMAACDKKEDGGNSNPSHCYHSESLKNQYKESAHQLLFREIQRDSTAHPNYNDPYLSEERTANILNAIQAVYDLNTPQTDSVFNHYNIRTFPLVDLKHISLQVDTSAVEVERLIEGRPTGNALLDSIVNEFGFNEVNTSYSYPRFNWISMVSDENLNLLPLMEALETLPFFYIVESGGAVGDGNDIELERQANKMILDFSRGWGDCPSGCIKRKHWIFEVGEDCHASYVHSYMD